MNKRSNRSKVQRSEVQGSDPIGTRRYQILRRFVRLQDNAGWPGSYIRLPIHECEYEVGDRNSRVGNCFQTGIAPSHWKKVWHDDYHHMIRQGR